jgi:AraC family transcriptional regulator
MLKPYELLEGVLITIEKGLKNEINVDTLADEFGLSNRHLERLFKFSFHKTIGAYIRSRKLAVSLDDLLKTDSNILDIALAYGFDYEQSYIRAFKREFRITPGDLRKSGTTVKVTAPIHLFDESKLPDGVLFGPEIVMVPQFHIIGKRSRVSFDNSLTLAPILAKQFWDNERSLIKNISNPNVYIGFTNNINREAGYSDYLPAVQVKKYRHVPESCCIETFETSLCARFRYIGKHHYNEINRNIARSMYNAIGKYTQDEQSKYVLLNNKVYFEKIDTSLHSGKYCQMEWFTPVCEKEAAAFKINTA